MHSVMFALAPATSAVPVHLVRSQAAITILPPALSTLIELPPDRDQLGDVNVCSRSDQLDMGIARIF